MPNQQQRPTHAEPTVKSTDEGEKKDTTAKDLTGEHVLGDDPARTQGLERGFHDSLTGRQVDEAGMFIDGSGGPIEKHRIVANDWPAVQEKIDDPAKRGQKDQPRY